MHDSYPPISELLPHQGYMRLLDKVCRIDGESLTAEVWLTADSSFAESGQVGSWVGLEYMAQAVAAFVSWQSRQHHQQPKPGLLLGTRRYQTQCSQFELGQRLQVTVERAFQSDEGLAAFDCRIEQQGQLLAQAVLTLYQPEDFNAFIHSGASA